MNDEDLSKLSNQEFLDNLYSQNMATAFEHFSWLIGFFVIIALLWLFSYPMSWIILSATGVLICAVITIYHILTFNLILALNWFLIGVILLAPFFTAVYFQARKEDKAKA